ncbi:MAG TPA: hypothetical protein PKM27_04270 [Saprospiraceae bacterium]|nr:hypothetical protein [Saprospiraceae bacterium]HNT20510.1 hypothetical protein [Saprospiraceae bacterium]
MDASKNPRLFLLEGLQRFIKQVTKLDGVIRISLLGSIVTPKTNLKDIDVLVLVADHIDLAPLATYTRQLMGQVQSINRGADVFLADERGNYIGRICHWRDCRPGIRRACQAMHCGRRTYLYDDLSVVTLNAEMVRNPPVTLWPTVEIRCPLPRDVREWIEKL